MATRSSSQEANAFSELRDVLSKLRDATLGSNPDGSEFETRIGALHVELVRVVGALGELELRISTNRILYQDDEVYKSESRQKNLAFELFRQGIRRLTFKPGVTQEEVRCFARHFSRYAVHETHDESLVTSLWRESMTNIVVLAVDGFTEKVIMAEEKFVGRFHSVLNDIAPGIMDMDDEPPARSQMGELAVLGDLSVASRLDVEQAKNRARLRETSSNLRPRLEPDVDVRRSTEHLAGLVARAAVRPRCPVSVAEFAILVGNLLTPLLKHHFAQEFADLARSFHKLGSESGRGPESARARIQSLARAATGAEVAREVAVHLAPEHTDFTAWTRWFFVTHGNLSAPALLEMVNGCPNRAGADWLKDLIRRQGAASLDPWVDRMRDPNPDVVLEVIDVIEDSGLVAQATALLLETLQHADARVRERAISALPDEASSEIREALLPFLSDPASRVRRAVVSRFVHTDDKSVSLYLANVARSDESYAYTEDELRELFEALAVLGGEKFFEIFESRLELREKGTFEKLISRGPSVVEDTPNRRAAISGLSHLGISKAFALIKDVQSRADLALAAHCEVTLRLSNRRSGDASARDEMSSAPVPVMPPASILESIDVGRERMGAAFYFDANSLGLPEISIAPEAIETKTSENHGIEKIQLKELGPRPLLTHDEVIPKDNDRRLRIEPPQLKGSHFRLIGAQAVLVGVEETSEDNMRRASVGSAAVAIERIRQTKSHHDWHHGSERNLEDILQNYLDAEVSEAGNGSVAGSTVDDQSVDELLSAYLGKPTSASADQVRHHDEAQPSREAPTPSQSDHLVGTSPEKESGVDALLEAYLDEDSQKEPAIARPQSVVGDHNEPPGPPPLTTVPSAAEKKPKGKAVQKAIGQVETTRRKESMVFNQTKKDESGGSNPVTEEDDDGELADLLRSYLDQGEEEGNE